MDTSDILDGDFGDGATMQTRDLNYLRTAGKWGRFISITSLILIGIGLVFMLIGGSSALMMGSIVGAAGFILIPYLILFGVLVYIYILMYQFSTNAISAASGKSKLSMTVAMQALSRMFVLGGVLLIIYLGITVFGFLAFFATAAAF